MTTITRILAAILILLTLSCGNGHSGLTARNAGTTPPNGNAFLYVSNTAANTITAFRIDNSSGTLLPVSGSPFRSSGTAPGRAAVNTAAHLLFVINQGSSTVSSYRIDSEFGSLLPGSTMRTEPGPVTLALHPTANFIYVLSRDGLISGFSFDVNGIFTPLPLFPTSLGTGATNARDLAIDPRSPFLFASSDAGISILQIAADGSLTLVTQPIRNTQLSPSGLAFNPVNGFLYSLDFAQGTLFGWDFTSLIGVNAGLTPLPGTPTPAGSNPVWLSILPSGAFAYATNASNGDILAFSLSLNGTPVLVPGSPFSASPSVAQIAIDPSGLFLYTASPGVSAVGVPTNPDRVNGFRIDLTGILLPMIGAPFSVPSPGGAAVARFPLQQ
jgi:6-phosphogluconolactonase (cycloisomerase 2 family)